MLQKKFPMQKAVALKYNKEKDNAPNVTAKGDGEAAKNIIKIAEENDIPIQKDEDLVNMLSQIELNKEIPVELYQAVSEVFSFIYNISNNMEKDENQKDKNAKNN